MKRPAWLMALVALMAGLPALGKPLSCPALAPAGWGLAHARLESVRVLSYPADEALNDAQPLPIMAPDDETTRAGTLVQTWRMNTDFPQFAFKFDCLYTGTERFLRIDAACVKLCVATSGTQGKTFHFQCR